MYTSYRVVLVAEDYETVSGGADMEPNELAPWNFIMFSILCFFAFWFRINFFIVCVQVAFRRILCFFQTSTYIMKCYVYSICFSMQKQRGFWDEK